MLLGPKRNMNAIRPRLPSTVGVSPLRRGDPLDILRPRQAARSGFSINTVTGGQGFEKLFVQARANNVKRVNATLASIRAKVAAAPKTPTFQQRISTFMAGVQARNQARLNANTVQSAATTNVGFPSGVGTPENPIMLPEEVVLPGGMSLPTWALFALGGLVLVLLFVRR